MSRSPSKMHSSPCKDPHCTTCKGSVKNTPAQEVTKMIQEVTDLMQKKPDIAAKILAEWVQKPRSGKQKKAA